nr:BLUF domain-containing protein [uncultured Gellertiella sp.]
MSEMLYHLVYYSRNLVSDDETGFAAEIDSILASARRNNPSRGITGALLFNAGCFAQILEGTLDAIEATFERIQQDERHGDVSLLALQPIAARSFPNWAMGFVGNRSSHAGDFARIGLSTGFDLAHMSGDQIHTILKDLTMEQEDAGH